MEMGSYFVVAAVLITNKAVQGVKYARKDEDFVRCLEYCTLAHDILVDNVIFIDEEAYKEALAGVKNVSNQIRKQWNEFE